MIFGVVCARKGSKRLPRKNELKINNKTLSEIAVNKLLMFCNKVIFYSDIEIEELKDITKKRVEDGEDTPLQSSVLIALADEDILDDDIVIYLMPSAPIIDSGDIFDAMELLMTSPDINIVRSYNRFGKENGLIAAKYKFIRDNVIDVYTGCIVTSGFEIHTKEEFSIVKKIMEANIGSKD